MSTEHHRRRPLKVGYHLPEIERHVRWNELMTLTREAEAVGFDSVWVPDHLLYRFEDQPAAAPWECWSLLSAIAAVTSRVELGPLVLCTAFRNPALIAKMAATVDEISGGRLVLGLGAGWHEPEFTTYGVSYDHRASRFVEAFTIIHRLLRHGEVDFEGRFYQARECELIPSGPRAAGPPLMIGSQGERVLAATLPQADAWNAWYLWSRNDPARLRPIMDRVDEISRSVERDPAAVRRTSAVLVSPNDGHQSGIGSRPAPAITGTVEQVAEGLRAFAAIGIDEVMVVLDPNTVESIEWFGRVLELLDAG
jgi:alkanesulfonate monooxygenase SsuD/methylene tetrahydromethanopterin reductase-like flavin-dependent oxidoreductase (luciferase family)